MNNSFERIIDGMIESLRVEVIPNTHGDYARGQAYGVIFLLKNLRLRADWSATYLKAQLDALAELHLALEAIDNLPSEAPRPQISDVAQVPEALQSMRDAGDERVCALIDWLNAHRQELTPELGDAISVATRTYIHRQLRQEIKTSAKPMFAEMSLGREINEVETR